MNIQARRMDEMVTNIKYELLLNSFVQPQLVYASVRTKNLSKCPWVWPKRKFAVKTLSKE